MSPVFTSATLPAAAVAVALAVALAWHMLRDEVRRVEAALRHGGRAAGRARLSRLVSRNTAVLDEALVRESALETLAENLNDSVVAPLFWFAVAGLPGAALYRQARRTPSPNGGWLMVRWRCGWACGCASPAPIN